MRKILLIEDRSHRQKDFLRLSNINLNDYTDILDNKIDNKYEEFIKVLQDKAEQEKTLLTSEEVQELNAVKYEDIGSTGVSC